MLTVIYGYLIICALIAIGMLIFGAYQDVVRAYKKFVRDESEFSFGDYGYNFKWPSMFLNFTFMMSCPIVNILVLYQFIRDNP